MFVPASPVHSRALEHTALQTAHLCSHTVADDEGRTGDTEDMPDYTWTSPPLPIVPSREKVQ